MTAKQAIKARCFDCSGRECGFTDCALKGLAKAKVSKKAIMAYCRWCLNGHSFKVCSSPDCAIYQCRKEREEALKNPGVAKKQGVQRGFFHGPGKKGTQIPLSLEKA
jgi:hypothetical protein